MSSQQQRFKTLLIRDKQWLGELYLATNILQSNRILNFATDTKLDTLIRYFHFQSTTSMTNYQNGIKQIALNRRITYFPNILLNHALYGVTSQKVSSLEYLRVSKEFG